MLDDYSVRKIQEHLRNEMTALEESMSGIANRDDCLYNFSNGEHHACYVLSRLIEALNR